MRRRREPVILVLHNRYRTTGGEERAVDDLTWLVREHLSEEVEVIQRDSATLSRARAAVAMLRGGLEPGDVGAAVRRTGARVVHAHNLNPAFGWRALAAAREAGARTILHLHNYRLVCAVGTCFTRGEDCTRCHGHNTAPGVALSCRGPRAEAAVYGAGLALHQRRLTAQVDRFVVPSAFALDRLRQLGAPLGGRATIVPHVVRTFVGESRAAEGTYALLATRLAPEKGVETALDACAAAGVPLVVCGDGPLGGELRARATTRDIRFTGPLSGDLHGRAATREVRFTGRVTPAELSELRGGAALAIVPSRGTETFGLAAAEAMAAGVPVVASRIGALPEIVPPEGLVPPGDSAGLAAAIARRYGDASEGRRGLERIRERCAPSAVARRLRAVYDEG
ncbi:MAG: glycosyltransferase family 4 protein [Solirubrobacteraceae bacterium]